MPSQLNDHHHYHFQSFAIIPNRRLSSSSRNSPLPLILSAWPPASWLTSPNVQICFWSLHLSADIWVASTSDYHEQCCCECGCCWAYGNYIFSFLSDHQTTYNGNTILHSHQQSTRVPISSRLHHLLFSVFQFMAILADVKRCLVVWDCVPSDGSILSCAS